MQAKDFEYAGEYLKDWGYIILDYNNKSGFETIESDSKLSFNTVSLLNGKHFSLTYAYYEDRTELKFCICKSFCPSKKPSFINEYECREIKRWLNRPTFHKFKLIQPNWQDIYMEGSFNINEVELNGKTYFLELHFISNHPFALHEPIKHKCTLQSSSDSYSFLDISDEIGHIYPNLKIKCLQAGNLILRNSNESREMIVNNCKKNEILTVTPELIISSSDITHPIQNDFNYNFFRIANQYGNRKNTLSSSIPVELEFTYSPYVKAVR